MADTEDMYVLCNKPMLSDESVAVPQSTTDRFTQAGVERKDRKHFILRKYCSLVVHKNFRTTYAQRLSIEAALKKAATASFVEAAAKPSRATRASGEQTFDYSGLCLFCSEDASEALIESQKTVLQEKRVVVKLVISDNTRDNILYICKERDVAIHDAVYERVSVEANSPDVRARYHSHYFSKFSK